MSSYDAPRHISDPRTRAPTSLPRLAHSLPSPSAGRRCAELLAPRSPGSARCSAPSLCVALLLVLHHLAHLLELVVDGRGGQEPLGLLHGGQLIVDRVGRLE